MIYLLADIEISPGKMAEYKDLFGGVYLDHLKKVGRRFVGAWETWIGPRSKIINLWAFDSLGAADEIRRREAKDEGVQRINKQLRPLINQYGVRMLRPLPFSPMQSNPAGAVPTGDVPRTYMVSEIVVAPGRMAEYQELFGGVYFDRLKTIGKTGLVGAWETDLGEPRSQIVDLWAYNSPADYSEVSQRQAQDEVVLRLGKQLLPMISRYRVSVVLPLAFSPLQ